jgi:sterol 3beta-glucosyltransferase
VISCSNFVIPRPKDWNGNIHQHGYWFVEENEGYTPPKELREFIEGGEKPVYIGFGSVFHKDEKDELVKLIIGALHASGRRGIICGMGEISELPENIYALNSIPHTWLFPRCSVVCHHGGAGTSATGFAAGVPSVIIPFSNDQFAWAHRAFDLGIGSRPIPRKKLTGIMLADAITYALRDKVIEKARFMGENIQSENGAFITAKLIDNLF